MRLHRRKNVCFFGHPNTHVYVASTGSQIQVVSQTLAVNYLDISEAYSLKAAYKLYPWGLSLLRGVLSLLPYLVYSYTLCREDEQTGKLPIYYPHFYRYHHRLNSDQVKWYTTLNSIGVQDISDT